MQSLANK